MGFGCLRYGSGSMWRGMGFGMGGFGSWVGPLVGLILTVGLFVLLSLIIVWLIVRLGPGRSATAVTGGDSIDIARVRLARGEISRDEFDQIREGLRDSG